MLAHCFCLSSTSLGQAHSQAGSPKRPFIRTAIGAAVGEFAIDDHGRNALDTKLLGSAGHCSIVHVKHTDLT